MKRMIVVLAIVGVLGAALFAFRNRGGTSGGAKSPAVQAPRSFDAWQEGVKLDAQPQYPGDTAEKRELLRRLRREERRQRPQEGRN